MSGSERKTEQPEKKGYSWTEDLVIIEKYDDFLEYIYPVFQKMPKIDGVLKQNSIELVWDQVDLLYKAIKSNQISKLYEADGGVACIRHRLRSLTKMKLISLKQNQTAQIKIDEVGKILGSIIKKRGK